MAFESSPCDRFIISQLLCLSLCCSAAYETSLVRGQYTYHGCGVVCMETLSSSHARESYLLPRSCLAVPVISSTDSLPFASQDQARRGRQSRCLLYGNRTSKLSSLARGKTFEERNHCIESQSMNETQTQTRKLQPKETEEETITPSASPSCHQSVIRVSSPVAKATVH